jgi:hypothetical protein
MSTRHRMLALGLACLAALQAGCQSTAKAQPAVVHAPGNPNTALALAGEDAGTSDWEAGRLDFRLGSTLSPITTDFNVAVIRQYDNLGTSNGIPRDNSWTYSRGVQVRSGP